MPPRGRSVFSRSVRRPEMPARSEPVAYSGVRKHSSKAPKLQGETIKIIVGREGAIFHVHKSIICAASNFFRTASKPCWKEPEGTVRLPKDDPEIFQIYVDWLYFRSIYSEKEGDQYEVEEEKHDREWGRLVNLYVYGDLFHDFDFCNAIVDAICEKHEATGKFESAVGIIAYQKSMPSSPIRRLVVDMCAYVGQGSWLRHDGDLDTDAQVARREFCDDVIRTLYQLRDARLDKAREYPWVMNRCIYHQHRDGRPKCGESSS